MDNYWHSLQHLNLPLIRSQAASSTSSSAMSRSTSTAQSSSSSVSSASLLVKTTRPRGRPPTRQPQIDGQLRFPCDFQFSDGSICRKSFNRKSDKERHHHTHTNTRNHPCMLCDKAFIQTSALKVHVRTHTKEKPHHCGTCQKRFSDSSSLARHRRTHGPPQFACKWCQSLYKTSQLLQRHEKQCPKCPPVISAQLGHYAAQTVLPAQQQQSVAFDHTQLWQSTGASLSPNKRPSPMPEAAANMQFTGQYFDSTTQFENTVCGSLDNVQLLEHANDSRVNSYSQATSFAPESRGHDLINSARSESDAFSEDNQRQHERAQPHHEQQDAAVRDRLSRSQQVLQAHASQLLQYQTNFPQQENTLAMRNYANFFNPYSSEDPVRSIYLENSAGNGGMLPETDYSAQVQSHPMPISSHPVTASVPGYSLLPQQFRVSHLVDLTDPFKLDIDVTGCGEPLPSEYDLSQGC